MPSPAPSSSDYSIVLIGNSWTWYDSVGADSLSGLLQQQLAADQALAPLHPLVRYIGWGGFDAAKSVFSSLAEVGVDKLVVMQLEFVYLEGTGVPGSLPRSSRRLALSADC